MSRWTHAQCWPCWTAANPDGRMPGRMVAPPVEWCCFCGQPTDSGIYVRADPAVTLCHGDHETFATGDGREVTDMEETRSEDFAAEAAEETAEAEGTEATEEAAEAEGQDDEAGSPE